MARYIRWTSEPYQISGTSRLVCDPFHQNACRVPEDLGQILDKCTTARTLKEHAANLCRTKSSTVEEEAKIIALLEAAANVGLLADIERVLPRIDYNDANYEQIGTIAILTRDRPDSFTRCLIRTIQACKRYDRRPRLIVMDDSTTNEVAQRVRAICRNVKRTFDFQIHYAGQNERKAFCEQLIRMADIPSNVARFALLGRPGVGFRTGAGRNAIMLETVGQRVYSIDDDAVCSLSPSPDMRGGVSFSSEVEPCQIRFYERRDQALAAVPEADIDFLAIHENLLGCTPAEVVKRHGGPSAVEVRDISTGLLFALVTDSGRVRVTTNGLAGDGAFGTPYGFLALQGSNRERICTTEVAYRGARVTRECLWVAHCPVVTDSIRFMTTSVAIDHATILPPFFPVGRNSDGLFSQIMRLLSRESLIAHIPYAVRHDPPEPRRLNEDDVWKCADVFRISDAVRLCLLSAPAVLPGQKLATSLARLGTHVANIGSLSDSDFCHFLLDLRRRAGARTIRVCENLLVQYDNHPEYWRRDLVAFIECYARALEVETCTVPLELRYADEPYVELRNCLIDFGHLLEIWPAMEESASALAMQDVRLAQRC